MAKKSKMLNFFSYLYMQPQENHIFNAASQIKNALCASDYIQTTFFYLGRFLKKLADDQFSSVIKGSIYHIKHMPMQPFTMGVD